MVRSSFSTSVQNGNAREEPLLFISMTPFGVFSLWESSVLQFTTSYVEKNNCWCSAPPLRDHDGFTDLSSVYFHHMLSVTQRFEGLNEN